MEKIIANTLNVLNEWCENNSPVFVGIILLTAAFILSFSCKTAWGAWKNRK